MKVSDLLMNEQFDVNANAKIFAGGQWNVDGKLVGEFSCGTMENCPDAVLESNITYITTDNEGNIVIECDSAGT